jgi:HopA1 effector protein family
MSAPYRKLVGDAIAALVLLSPTSFTWFGRPVGVLPASVETAMDPESARAYLLHSMQVQLYADLYCRGFASPSVDSPSHGLARRPEPFVETLAASNTGRGSREPGWKVVSASAEQVVVERHGLKLWIAPGDVVDLDGEGLHPDARVHVRLPNELRKLSPGFYMALGDAGFETEQPTAIVRFYWHLASTSAPRLIHALTSRLNKARLPFRVKVVNDPARYTRCDAGVLYVHGSDYEATARAVRATYNELAGGLRRATPAFAKPLAPGLAVAEDPGTGDSFGMHRARLLAEGIVDAHEQGRGDGADAIDTVAARFAQDGIDLDAPYLNPGSTDRYVL